MAPYLLSTIDYTYRERHGEAIYRFKSLPARRRGACPRGEGGGRDAPPSDFLRHNMMRGSDYPHSVSTFPQSRKILAEILAGVPDDQQGKPAPDPDPGIAGGSTARLYKF